MSRRAWPPAEVEYLDGWELRATGGYTRRANSANPYPPQPDDLAAAVDHVEGWYASRGLRPIFRLTPVSTPPALEPILFSRDYTADRGTLVMAGAASPGPEIDVADRPEPEWIEAKDAWARVPLERRSAWLDLLAGTRGLVGYGLVRTEGRVVAAGHAVVEDGMVGLFGLVVDPARRRKGFGELLSRGLIGWGAANGAATVWLQVYARSSPAAVALYEKLGLTTRYEYWYLEAPARPG